MNAKWMAEPGADSTGGNRGSILIPFLFMLSLLSLLSVSAIKLGGAGNITSEALVERCQAQMAALSGVEIAYRRLAVDPAYAGEVCTPFRDSSCTLDVTVTNLGDGEYEIVSQGAEDGCESLVRTRARAAEQVCRYPLCVGGDLQLGDRAGVLGDVFVRNQVRGTTDSLIAGTVYLQGQRTFRADAAGDIICVDGVQTPRIDGETYDGAPDVQFPSVDLTELYDLAAAAGQVYSGSIRLENQSFEGVVYIDGGGSRPFFNNVTINGVLVCEGAMGVTIESGLLKIHANDAFCESTALLAPEAALLVESEGFVDVYGLSYIGSVDFQGGGSFTGPVIVRQDLIAVPSSYFACQFPSAMTGFSGSGVTWSESIVVELEYEEL